MAFKNRILRLEVCDYNHNVMCSLYDNNSMITGQAYEVVVSIERNGWKELSFYLPSRIHTQYGEEDNPLLEFIKADYLIRLIDDYETDWYLISEPKITHEGYSKTVSVVAGHVSQLLKLKNLGLEFSDDEGNNVGTPLELLTTILEGTGWTPGYFKPEDFIDKRTGQTKVRSLICPSKSGAFKLISSLCELFDAKPIYHGDTKTVDIVPLNPFSDYVRGTIPQAIKADSDVLELHYSKSLKSVSRTLNTENMVTKLYAYGSYGDTTSGYCAIDECTHTEYTITVNENLEAGKKYYFEIISGNSHMYYSFVATSVLNGDTLIYSLLDPASQMYVWNTRTRSAIAVENKLAGEDFDCTITSEEVDNMFSFLMDFNYYKEVGLFSSSMLQTMAEYQRDAPSLLLAAKQAAAQMADCQSTLSETIGSIAFCRLDINSAPSIDGEGNNEPYLKLILEKSTYPDGVIYRSDYDENKKNRFKWRAADQLDQNGDPLNAATSILYVIHDTNPITWDTAYLKSVDDEGDPSVLTFWIARSDVSIYTATDQFFLFSYNGINGRLGSLQAADESALQSIDKATTLVTEQHKMLFVKRGTALPDVATAVNIYGWLWKYDPTGQSDVGSELYFCYKDLHDDSWQKVYVMDSDPTWDEEIHVAVGEYWYDWRAANLYKRKNDNTWLAINKDQNTDMLVPTTYKASLTDQKIAALFGTVYMYGLARDKYYQGMSERYIHTRDSNLAVGNYYFEDPYKGYHIFSTEEELNSGDTITYNYIDGWITITHGGVDTSYTSKNYRFDNVNYHLGNIFDQTVAMQTGKIDETTGTLIVDTNYCRTSSYLKVVPSTRYLVTANTLPQQFTVHYYNDKKMWLGKAVVSGLEFTVPNTCYNIKLVFYDNNASTFNERYPDRCIAADIKDRSIIIDNINYFKLSAEGEGENIGILNLMRKFKDYANDTYDTYYKAMKTAQERSKKLENDTSAAIGDLWKEGYWQDDNYVDGDEQLLYDDAMDTIQKISRPEASYTLDYIDLYSSNADNEEYGVIEETIPVSWPDLNISTAVHLVDEDIGINEWAYIEKIQKNYDNTWKTKLTINTNLTTLSQHSFSDVMSNIADVAAQVKASVSKYDTVSVTSVSKVRLDDILADLVTMTKIVEHAGGRITEFENELTGHSSMIKQSANEIVAEVKRNDEMSARITMTENSIENVVTSIIPEAIGYDVSVDTPDGTFISDNAIIHLNPVVKNGSTVIDLATRTVTWERNSGDSTADTAWNNSHSNVKYLTLTSEDVVDHAVFTMSITLDEVQYSVPVTVANIVEQNDAIEVYLAADHPSYQVYDSSTSTYAPNWATTNLHITPSVYINGEAKALNTSGLTVAWKKRVGSNSQEVNLGQNETVSNGILTVSANVLSVGNTEYITYVCTVSYGNSTSKQSTSFSLMSPSSTYHNIEIAGSNVFTYDANRDVSPQSITVKAEKINCNVSAWQYYGYQGNVPGWYTYPRQAVNDELEIRHDDKVSNDSVFVNNILTLRVTTNVPGLTDVFTIYKVYDGTNGSSGTSPKSAFLTNSNYTFVADEDGKCAYQYVSFNLVAYDGATKVTPVLDSTTPYSGSIQNELSVSIGSVVNNELPITISVAANATLGTTGSTNGTVTFNLTSPITTHVNFNWSKLNEGKEGTSIASVTNHYKANTSDTTPPAEPAGTKWPTSISASGFNTTNKYLWSYEEVKDSSNNVINTTTKSVLSVWPSDGEPGDPGRGILQITEWYNTSNDPSNAPNAWYAYGDNRIQPLSSTNKFLWNYEVITYDDDNTPHDTHETAKRIIGTYGDTGDQGAPAFHYGLTCPGGQAYNSTNVASQGTLTVQSYQYHGSTDVTSSTTRQWKAIYGGQDHTLTPADPTSGTIAVPLVSGGMIIQCRFTYDNHDYYDTITLTDKSNVSSTIQSSAGDKFVATTSQTTLRCAVYENGAEIDSAISGNTFSYSWTKLNKNGQIVAPNPYATTKSITVGYSDISEAATFVCVATYGSYTTQSQFTITVELNIVSSDSPPSNPVTGLLWLDTSTTDSKNVDLLKRWNGTQWVETTMSYNESQRLVTTVSQYNTRMLQLEDSIQNTVTKNEYNIKISDIEGDLATKADSITTLQSEVRQNADNITASITTSKTYTDQELGKVTTSISNWINFDENGLELGKSNSDFKAILSNEELGFYQGTDEVSYINNNAMYITEARVTNTLSVGTQTYGWFDWIMTPEGLGMKWKV